MQPELLAYVGGAVQRYKSQTVDAHKQGSGNAASQIEPGTPS
jgi:hypothetical protein